MASQRIQGENTTVTVNSEEIEDDNLSRRQMKLVIFNLFFCFAGLQLCFVGAGVIQENIMHPSDQRPNNTISLTKPIILTSRIVGMGLSKLILMFDKTTPHSNISFMHYFIPALSNGISSWCQYEALSYVIFPTQLLAKSFKMIPSMLMGLFVNQKTYSIQDYFIAFLISSGTFLFANSRRGNLEFTFTELLNSSSSYGTFLLILYLVSDSFTGQWQSRMFNLCSISPYEMMFGVNTFAALIAFLGLANTEDMIGIIAILDWTLFYQIILLACLTSFGQLFIFYIVKRYDPVVLVIMMTTRQIFSMFLSCSIFDHHFETTAKIGIFLVFLGVFLQVWKKIQQSTKDKLE